MKALEPDEEDARVNALRFMVETRLIDNPALGEALQEYLADKSRSLPQFQTATGPSSIVVPRTAETVGFTDFDVFLCDNAWLSATAQSLADAVIGALQLSGRVGEIKKKQWILYSEVPLDMLRDKTTILIDEVESAEQSRLESVLRGVPALPPLQVLPNRGKPTPWRISIILCPNP